MFNALSNGMGGIDWQALPLVAALEDVEDLERLARQLLVIKLHQPPEI